MESTKTTIIASIRSLILNAENLDVRLQLHVLIDQKKISKNLAQWINDTILNQNLALIKGIIYMQYVSFPDDTEFLKELKALSVLLDTNMIDSRSRVGAALKSIIDLHEI